MNQRLRSVAVGAVLAGAVLWTCIPPGQRTRQTETSNGVSTPTAPFTAPRNEAHLNAHGTHPSFAGLTTPLFSRYVPVRDRDVSVLDQSVFVLKLSEVDPVTGERHKAEYEYVAPFQIEYVSTRTTSDVYVLGVPPEGGYRLERWTLSNVLGAHYAERPLSSAPIGEPIEPGAMKIGITGGVFDPPAERERPTLRTSLIWAGNELSHVESIDVDPDGRFVMLAGIGATEGIYRLENTPGSVPILAFDVSAVGMTSIWGLTASHHPRDGMVWALKSSASNAPYAFFALDADNDGYFDGHLSLAYDEYQTYHSEWDHDFHRYGY